MLITARNKSRNSLSVSRPLNYTGVAVDTSKIYKFKSDNDQNIKAISSLINNLLISGYKFEEFNDRNMFRNVKSYFIADFISSIRIPLENKKFDIENISNFIREEKYYEKWDIVFATGDNDSSMKYIIPFVNKQINPIHRKFEVRDEEKIIRISKNNNRLVEPGIFNSGLSDKQIEEAYNLAKKRNDNKNVRIIPIISDYLSVSDRNPLLVILPIILNSDQSDSKEVKEKKENLMKSFGNPLIGFAIGFFWPKW